MAYSKIIILCSGGIKFGSSSMIENKIRHNPYSGFELGRRLPSTFQIGLLVSHWLEIEDFFGNIQIGLAGNFFLSNEIQRLIMRLFFSDLTTFG